MKQIGYFCKHIHLTFYNKSAVFDSLFTKSLVVFLTFKFSYILFGPFKTCFSYITRSFNRTGSEPEIYFLVIYLYSYAWNVACTPTKILH